MNQLNDNELRDAVRNRYATIARTDSSSCCGTSTGSSCCQPTKVTRPEDISAQVGYSLEELSTVPDGANLGLGCGNPQAIADLKPGETVLDLGSGGGFDCFLAARQVGETGLVIGVDMTPDMISKARENSFKGGYTNVDFRLGEIEHLPVADGSVDVIISNCVINLSPTKQQVISEAFRVLKPGGRLAISDIVALRPLPDLVQQSIDSYCGCITGAALADDISRMLTDAGFQDVIVEPKRESRKFILEWFPDSGFEDYVASAVIKGVKSLPSLR